jgi:hypothetical protein
MKKLLGTLLLLLSAGCSNTSPKKRVGISTKDYSLVAQCREAYARAEGIYGFKCTVSTLLEDNIFVNDLVIKEGFIYDIYEGETK